MSANPPRVLIADPPWKFRDSLPGNGRGASKNYDCLSVEEICRFALPVLAPDATLILWRVSSMVEEAYRVCRMWGFVPKSEIVWLKRTKLGKRHFGMGHHVRSEHESAIVAIRGRAKPKTRSTRSTFEAMTPTSQNGHAKHSAKPDAFYELVERTWEGPYVELFARRHRGPEWECFGDELSDREVA